MIQLQLTAILNCNPDLFGNAQQILAWFNHDILYWQRDLPLYLDEGELQLGTLKILTVEGAD